MRKQHVQFHVCTLLILLHFRNAIPKTWHFGNHIVYQVTTSLNTLFLAANIQLQFKQHAKTFITNFVNEQCQEHTHTILDSALPNEFVFHNLCNKPHEEYLLYQRQGETAVVEPREVTIRACVKLKTLQLDKDRCKMRFTHSLPYTPTDTPTFPLP